MAIETYLQQLENVQKAIRAIEDNGQSFTIKDRTYTAADLNTLYRREQRLRPLAEREQNGGGIGVSYGYPMW